MKISIKAIFAVFALVALSLAFQNCADELPASLNEESNSSEQGVEPDPIAKGKSCTGPGGEEIADGESVNKYYTSDSSVCGTSCEKGLLTCVDGQLQGDAVHLQCTPKLCDARNVMGGKVENLVVNAPYLVHVLGLIDHKGDRDEPLNPVSVRTCDGVGLAATPTTTINWPDGNGPQSASLAIQAPASGCIEAYTDLGIALNVTVEQLTEPGANVMGDKVILPKNGYYNVSVNGVTENKGQNNEDLNPVQLVKCDVLDPIIATQTVNIDWHDGQIGQNASFGIITDDQDLCVQGITDLGAALNLTVAKKKSEIMNVVGNNATLKPNKRYMVHAYGTTQNKGQGDQILGPIRVDDCDVPEKLIAATQSPLIDWPDGAVPYSGALTIKAPADGCIRVYTDGLAAENLTIYEIK